jgi:hypothetical protein
MCETLTDRKAQFEQTIQRFSELNAAGRHHFIARIISRAGCKPPLAQELERVLQRLETDSHLAKCWTPAETVAVEAPPVLEAAA